MESALALVGTGAGRRWLRFRDPVALHRADHLDEVVPVVAAAERAALEGRWVVLVLAYDAAPAFEPAMRARRHRGVPLAVAAAFDRAEPVAGPRPGRHCVGRWTPTWDEAAHARAVESVRDHIARGDVYQANVTLRLRAPFHGDPESLLASLFRAQAPAYAALVDLGPGVVCSASPELLLARDGVRVTTRPMKGTIARARDPEADRAAVAALRASPKERAENTMIVDVARNDLGRVARTGSVVVDRLHAVEHYPTVHHLTSAVSARTTAPLAEVLRAVFPAASITGAPKVRATQVIAELEDTARGVYCGSVGVLAPGGRAQLNVAIRTAWVDRDRGCVEYGVGGGIVWDSRPAAEWAEVATKAAILDGGVPAYELLETMRWSPSGGLAARDRHRARLLSSAAALGFAVSPAAADAALDAGELAARNDAAPNDAARNDAAPNDAGASEAAAAGSDAGVTGAADARRVRLTVAADGTARVGVAPAPPVGTCLRPVGPWRAVLAAEPTRADDLLCQHKTTARTVYEQARAARPGADEVIGWNEQGLLTETTVGNLVFELDGALVTPALGAGLLAGVTRAALLDEGVVTEADLRPADLARAGRVWAVNAVRGWVALDVVAGG